MHLKEKFLKKELKNMKLDRQSEIPMSDWLSIEFEKKMKNNS